MNHLQHETSPYLLQHVNNPVDWYAWKPEAFERARKEDKPILVSIGYSTCHWCHVMERESFENEDVAAIMNENFINIKVDREERPDVDQIYMEACQVISGSGGWPLNCFLTPDGRPFYAGTYYPPVAAYNRPSWPQVLINISNAFKNKRQTVEEQANKLTDIISKSDKNFIADNVVLADQDTAFTPILLHNIYHSLEQRFDLENGGFGGAPKFPGTMSLEFLLQHYHFTQTQLALDHVIFSLDKMILGGIYDQLGGGFARYATDAKWLIPHFEKMLYDNALLVGLLAETYTLTGKELYKTTIEETLDFIAREMTSPEGGFYSALDADSEGVEGKFYIWDKMEIDSTLGDESALFCEFYDITEAGNWEGTNILWRPKTLAEFAKEKGLDATKLAEQFKKNREQLMAIRDKRIRPGLDDKILLSWNAMMCTAYAQAAAKLKRADYKAVAIHNLEFLLDKFRQPEALAMYHTYKDGKVQYEAFLDDYALLIEALITVYEISADLQLLQKAADLCAFVMEQFLDRESNLFYFTNEKQQDILLRRKELYDSATPSGNSTMVHNLQKLGILLGREDYTTQATKMLLAMKEAVERYPSSFSRWSSAIYNMVKGIHEIAIIGKEAKSYADEINAIYLPNRVIMSTEKALEEYPLTAGKGVADDTNIYVCKNYACQLPVTNIDAFKEMVNVKS
jgi:hypothetical protein